MDETLEIQGYCAHCKDPIHLHEPFVTDNGEIYHYKPCYRQLSNDEDDDLFKEVPYDTGND